VKAYVATTGVLFAAITVAHVWRVYEEGRGVAHDPFFLLLTVISAAFTVWALILLRRR